MDLKSFIHSLPKAELHLHLEGAVAAPTVIDLAHKHGVTLPDFRRVTYEALKRCADSNVRYAEFFFSPGAHLPYSVKYKDMLDGVIGGMHDAQRDMKIASRLIPAINRELGPATAEEFLDMVLADRRDEVIGIGLDYLEDGFPPGPYAAVYERARAAGLKATAHAGESGPAENIRDSIALLGCSRIDHGYHVVDDPALVAACAESGIGFTCCPSTTMYTTIWRDLDAEDHPIRRMIAAGLTVTINSDDPGLFRVDLDNEYWLVAEKMKVSREKLADVALNGIRNSWLDDTTKAQMTHEWRAEIAPLLT
jgi:adenosine deaminase